MRPLPYLRQLAGSLLSSKRQLLKRAYLLPSRHLGREVLVDVYRPAVPPWRLLQLTVFNDGQDFEAMNAKETMRELYEDNRLRPTLIVGVHAGDRMREYGTVRKRDYQGRGDLAPAYERFLLEELIPYLEGRYNIYHSAGKRAIAGFSLGGLSAFDLAWRNPLVFGVAGIFSGSLWYRYQPFDPADPDAHRTVHDYVSAAKKLPAIRCWFMAGTLDENDDRNNNGIIDSIDDTLQLMALLEKKGKEEGARTQVQCDYLEVEGGRHDPETWGKVLGDFLLWV